MSISSPPSPPSAACCKFPSPSLLYYSPHFANYPSFTHPFPPSFGFDISSISAIIGTKQYVDYFDNPSGTTQGGIGAALAGGSVIGAIMAGPVSNRIGRRDAIAFACLWWLVGTAVQAGCNGVGMLVAGRFVNGVCVGITSSQVPVYLVEITKKEKRGSVVVIQQLAIELGILIMYFAGYGMLLPLYRCCLRIVGMENELVIRLLVHPWNKLFQDRLGHSIHSLCLPFSRPSIPPKVSALARKGRTRR